ncbi:MAG: CoA-acylating methylmalonate-semialdehyde dehydrogenase [Candidatus Cloacimonetes bacterium]|nr:CoA-acylating methylmalonate-semialdehyde dehydrogenase [Candidatus Cloacimonadota bacterium]
MTSTVQDRPAIKPYVVSHYINGQVVAGHGSRSADIYNPALGEPVGRLNLANRQDINDVVAAAKKASAAWADTGVIRRSKVLFAMRERMIARTDEMARAITREHGKVLSDAKGEIGRAIETVEFACGILEQLKGGYSDQVASDIDVFSIRQPLGVIAGITPFNFPVMVPMWMAPVAIACGNAFILKPSERDPSASLMLAQMWQEAGLPDGVFNVLQGDKEAVDGLLTHPDVDGISFVGSTPIAKYVHETALAHGKRVQALGGAKNHALVMPDADMDLAAEHMSAAAFGSAGERCMAISVGIAVGSAADILAEKLREQANKVVVQDGMHPDSDMGPLVTRASQERVKRIIGEAEAAGAKLVADGRNIQVQGREQGFFVGPTVIDEVKTDMSAYTEEIFGPVLVILRVPTLAAGIELINANPYGNGTGIFTSSGAAAREFQRRIKVGMVGINVPVPVPVAWYSFGGWKDSLFGDYHIYGADGVRFCTRKKVVTQRWPELHGEIKASFDFPSH